MTRVVAVGETVHRTGMRAVRNAVSTRVHARPFTRMMQTLMLALVLIPRTGADGTDPKIWQTEQTRRSDDDVVFRHQETITRQSWLESIRSAALARSTVDMDGQRHPEPEPTIIEFFAEDDLSGLWRVPP